MAVREAYPDNHVFGDGMTFQNVRDAVVAAGKANMWHVAHEMAHRYRVQDMICLKCGTPNTCSQQHTYFTYRDKAIRICLKCNGGNIALR